MLPVPGKRDNLVQQLRRWLDNQAVTQYRRYIPLVRHLFAQWWGAEVGLIMDRTDIEDRWSILMLAAAFRHRALPLAWCVLPFGATDARTQITLLRQVQPWLPDSKRVRITLYGDCEFRAVAVQRYCQDQHWHWQLGLKSHTLFRQDGGDWQPLQTIAMRRGGRIPVPNVILTKEHGFGPVNLIADWTRDEETPRYVATDLPPDRDTRRWGRKRFWIEPFFRDWKRYGFDLERSKLVHPHRLETLLLGMATTTLWMVHIGQWVDETGPPPAAGSTPQAGLQHLPAGPGLRLPQSGHGLAATDRVHRGLLKPFCRCRCPGWAVGARRRLPLLRKKGSPGAARLAPAHGPEFNSAAGTLSASRSSWRVGLTGGCRSV